MPETNTVKNSRSNHKTAHPVVTAGGPLDPRYDYFFIDASAGTFGVELPPGSENLRDITLKRIDENPNTFVLVDANTNTSDKLEDYNVFANLSASETLYTKDTMKLRFDVENGVWRQLNQNPEMHGLNIRQNASRVLDDNNLAETSIVSFNTYARRGGQITMDWSMDVGTYPYNFPPVAPPGVAKVNVFAYRIYRNGTMIHETRQAQYMPLKSSIAMDGFPVANSEPITSFEAIVPLLRGMNNFEIRSVCYFVGGSYTTDSTTNPLGFRTPGATYLSQFELTTTMVE